MYFRTMQARKVLPNVLTMGNLISGVLVIIGLAVWPFGAEMNEFHGADISETGALAQQWKGSGMLMLAIIWAFGQLCDLFDGLAARWAKVDGAMGVQLDSMADLVSSGVTPAVAGIIFLHTWAPALPTAVKFLPLTMVLAAAWRLAVVRVGSGAVLEWCHRSRHDPTRSSESLRRYTFVVAPTAHKERADRPYPGLRRIQVQAIRASRRSPFRHWLRIGYDRYLRCGR